MNPILATDSYKFSHFMQYPPHTQHVVSYIEARGTKIPGVTEVVMAGLQPYIDTFLKTRITMEHVREAELFCSQHGVPFNREGWERIVTVHGGYIPVTIEAVPEGTPVPIGNMMVQVWNNDPELPWVTSYIETVLLEHVWYMSTVATLSREIKKVIKDALDETSDAPEAELPFKLHDFGYRGVAPGAAGPGGFAHLINFMGTDTVEGIVYAKKHYDADTCGFSISASEHSTMTTWGRENELAAYQNMVDKYAKKGAIFACVIDSYNTINAIDMWCGYNSKDNTYETASLLDQVRDRGATVVLRPDSGDAVQMPIDVIDRLMYHEGFDYNEKGYKVLPAHVRVIQGDGIDIDDVREILARLKEKKISASNIAFGMGGGLLQKVNRDTFKFAMKACQVTIEGVRMDVSKDPMTDPTKKSKRGRQWVGKNDAGEFITVPIHKEGKVELSSEYCAASLKGFKAAANAVYKASNGNVFHERLNMEQVRKNAEIK
jgi:nicotinamide phosphoribosyltransferase